MGHKPLPSAAAMVVSAQSALGAIASAALLATASGQSAAPPRSSTSNCSAMVALCTQEEVNLGRCDVEIPTDVVMDVGLPLLIILLMLGMGASISFDQMAKVFKKPGGVIAGMVSQFGLMPLLAFLLGKIFGLCPAQSIGMLIVGTTAGGTTSNLFAFWSGGDVALSVTMTTCSTLASLALQPLLLVAYADTSIEIPVMSILTTLFGGMLLPSPLGSSSTTTAKPGEPTSTALAPSVASSWSFSSSCTSG